MTPCEEMFLSRSFFGRTDPLSAPARCGLVLSALVLGMGCGDYDCKEDESHCDGNVAMTCDYSREDEMSRWKEDDCGRLTCTSVGGPARCATSKGPDPRCPRTDTEQQPEFCFEGSIVACTPSGHAARTVSCEAACVESDEKAECTQSSEPDPRCGDADEVCDGNLLIRCEQGYRIVESPCTSEVTNGEYCIQSGKTAFCAASPEPDPICTADQVCDGASQLTCREGYPLRAFDCDSRICATTSLGPTCVLDEAPDPACMDGTGRTCDGNTLLGCIDGYATSRTPCEEGGCRIFPIDADCTLTNAPDPNCLETRQGESYCDGDFIVECKYGYATSRQACGEGAHCTRPAGLTVAECSTL